MKRLIAILLLTLAGVGAAHATAACNTYVLDPANSGSPFGEIYDQVRSGTLTTDGNDITTVEDGKSRHFVTGSGGTGMHIMTAFPDDDPKAVIAWRIIDLSTIAKPGVPDEALLFGDDFYWPTCKYK